MMRKEALLENPYVVRGLDRFIGEQIFGRDNYEGEIGEKIIKKLRSPSRKKVSGLRYLFSHSFQSMKERLKKGSFAAVSRAEALGNIIYFYHPTTRRFLTREEKNKAVEAVCRGFIDYYITSGGYGIENDWKKVIRTYEVPSESLSGLILAGIADELKKRETIDKKVLENYLCTLMIGTLINGEMLNGCVRQDFYLVEGFGKNNMNIAEEIYREITIINNSSKNMGEISSLLSKIKKTRGKIHRCSPTNIVYRSYRFLENNPSFSYGRGDELIRDSYYFRPLEKEYWGYIIELIRKLDPFDYFKTLSIPNEVLKNLC